METDAGRYYLLLAVMGNYPVGITGRPQELPAFLLVMVLMPMTYATILVAMYRQLMFFREQQSERITRWRHGWRTSSISRR